MPIRNVSVQGHVSVQHQDLSLLIQVRKLAPKHMQNDEAGHAARHAHVTCANFSRQGEIVATYNDEVCIVQSCISTYVCSPTASDIIPGRKNCPCNHNVHAADGALHLHANSVIQYKSVCMSCNALHQPFSCSVIPLQSGSVLLYRNAQKHKSVWDLRRLKWI